MINQTNEQGKPDESSKDDESNKIPIENSSKDDTSKGKIITKEEKTSYKNSRKLNPGPNHLPYPTWKGKKVPSWFHQWKTREERVKKLKELFTELNKFDFTRKFPKGSLYKQMILM